MASKFSECAPGFPRCFRPSLSKRWSKINWLSLISKIGEMNAYRVKMGGVAGGFMFLDPRALLREAQARDPARKTVRQLVRCNLIRSDCLVNRASPIYRMKIAFCTFRIQ